MAKTISLLITLLSMAALGFADTITPYVVGATEVCLAQSGQTPASCMGPGDILDSQNSSSGISSTNTTLSQAGSSITGDASVTATYGVLHAAASDSGFIGSTPTFELALGAAIFSDGLTINDPNLTGQPGLLSLSYTLDGTVSTTGQNVSEAFLFVASPNFAEGYSTAFNGSVSGTFTIPVTLPFIYGQQFGLTFDLTAESGVGVPNVQYSVNETGSGVADFGDTLTLSGIVAEDSAGVPVNGTTITSASGTAYGPNGVLTSTPEPSDFVLLAIGILPIICLRHFSMGPRRLRLRFHKS